MYRTVKYICLSTLCLLLSPIGVVNAGNASSEAHERCHRIASEQARLPSEPFDNYGNKKAKSIGGEKGERVGAAIGVAKRVQAQRAIYNLRYNQCMKRYND